MKLLQRNSMYEHRFSHSFSQLNGTKYKGFGSTRGSITSRHSHKLPQLNRSFSSTAKSATTKLNIIDEKVQNLQNKTNDLRLQTRESRRFVNFLKEDLGERELMGHKNNLMLKINTLDKYARMSRLADQQRTKMIKNDCQKLNDSSINLKNLMDSLKNRVNNIQYTMGIYSGQQKHKI